MNSLYVLSAEFREAAGRIAESGLDDQTIADTLEGLSGPIEEKVVAIAKMIRNLQSEADAIRLAIVGMEKRALSAKGKADKLQDYARRCLQMAGIRKVNSPWFVVSIMGTPGSVVIDDESSVPEEFWTQPETPPRRISKAAVADAIRAGRDVPGAKMISGTRLDIR